MNNDTVIVIEDDLKNMKLLSVLLGRGNYNVISATEAENVISLAQEHEPCLILMDIQLPGLDGISATRLLKKDPDLCDIPVVAVSSYAMEEDIERAMDAGVSGYITKPIDVTTFLERIKDIVMEEKQKKKGPKRERPKSNKKILVVDDNPLNVKLLAGKLSREGYATTSAYNGEEALQRISEDLPDLILLDLMMPVVDGFEVLERLKKSSRTRDIHVIVITALSDEKELERAVDVADEILSKPVNTTELLMRVKSMLYLQDLRKHLQLEQSPASVPVAQDAEGDSPAGEKRARRILLVEDEEKDAKLVQKYLADSEYELSVARTGAEAISKLEDKGADLVLLDIILPDMCGLDICKQIKGSSETKDIQVIAVTNIRDLEERKKSFEVGIDEYLVKPVNKQELRLRIKTLIERKANLEKLRETMTDGVKILL